MQRNLKVYKAEQDTERRKEKESNWPGTQNVDLACNKRAVFTEKSKSGRVKHRFYCSSYQIQTILYSKEDITNIRKKIRSAAGPDMIYGF